MMERRPFTVIGGFLGAGKTTLLNRVLCEAAGPRYAVLVNDFGSLAIDEALIAKHDGQTIALSNGCICCSMSGGLISAMLELMQNPGRFDHILVEASGVAEPDRIMDFARLDPLLEPDAILVLADAETIAARLDDPLTGEVVGQQLRSADMVLLNRIDLAGPGRLTSSETRIASLTRAPILRCREAEIPPDVIIGTRLHRRSGDGGHSPHADAETFFRTRSFLADTPVDRVAFENLARQLPPRVIRGKGILTFADAPGKAFVWQRVGERVTLSPSAVQPPPPHSRLVLIATGEIDIDPGPAGFSEAQANGEEVAPSSTR